MTSESRRQRGKRHAVDGHAGLFGACLLCWPCATLCGLCGHVQADGGHGLLAVRDGHTVREEPGDCRFGTAPRSEDGTVCRCPRGVPVRPMRVTVIETEPLPRSSGRPTPRPFPVSSRSGFLRAAGHRS